MNLRDELRRLAGRRVSLRLDPNASAGSMVTGKVLGVLDAADGLVVTLEPDDRPGRRLTLHYHHILSAQPS